MLLSFVVGTRRWYSFSSWEHGVGRVGDLACLGDNNENKGPRSAPLGAGCTGCATASHEPSTSIAVPRKCQVFLGNNTIESDDTQSPGNAATAYPEETRPALNNKPLAEAPLPLPPSPTPSSPHRVHPARTRAPGPCPSSLSSAAHSRARRHAGVAASHTLGMGCPTYLDARCGTYLEESSKQNRTRSRAGQEARKAHPGRIIPGLVQRSAAAPGPRPSVPAQ
ncbi:hypothetical protein GGR56DRAFT_280031 [Xylariaceae sp. FL0804]|nr:hypothetical protein GGR56DRAFT_280031 [Xylariaceae sp. FL0804]